MPNFTPTLSQLLFDYINGLITADQAGPEIVSLAQVLNPIFGTDAEDRLRGTTAADILFGGAAQDFFFGGKGGDIIYTGSGTDYVRAGAGNDILLGEAGDDRLWRDNENDLIFGGIGNDRVYGGADHDTLYGGEGNDIGIGGSGNDDLHGENGNDVMRGGTGNDRLWGGEGNDRLWGDTGNDRISGDAGDDRLYGGDGNDILVGGAGVDQLYGGDGNDTVTAGIGTDNLYGDSGNDVLIGNGGENFLYGGDGDDTFNLGSGFNLIYGGSGADTFAHTGGETWITVFQAGDDQININGLQLNGDNFAVTPDNALINLASNEVIGQIVANGALTITLDTGTINVAGASIDDFGLGVVSGVLLPDGITNLLGTDNDDTFTGGHGDQAIFGGAGNDSFYNLHDDDYVFGGAGDDYFKSAINVKVETVHVYGGDGDDRFVHTDRSNDGDVLEWFGGNGADTFEIANGYGDITIHDFQAGIDTLAFVDIGVDLNHVFAFEGNIYNDFRFAIDPSIAPIATYSSNADGDVVISYGNSTTTITGATIDDLGLNRNTLHGSMTDAVLDAATNVNGGAGNETIIGTDGLDLLYGGAGNDVIVGGGGQTVSTFSTGWNYTNYVVRGDTIYGGDGDDTIFGDVNPDDTLPTDFYTQNVIYGGAGDDIILSSAGIGRPRTSSNAGYQDHVFGGEGSDTFIVSHRSETVVFDYDIQEDSILFHGEALNAENFYLSDSGDITLIESGEIVGHAQAAPNSVNNSGLSGFTGTVRGSYVEAVYVTSFGDDDDANSIIILRGYDSIDDLNLARESLNLVGTQAGEILSGDGGTDELYGLGGNDILYGGRGDDQLFGGNDNDTLYGEAGDDILMGGQGNDRLTGGDGSDTFEWTSNDGRDFITDFTVGQDSVTINGVTLDGNHFQITDGDLSLRGQTEVIGTINESTNGLSITLDGGSIVILGATLTDLDIAAPETTLYGTAGVDDFFGFDLSDADPVDIVDFEVGADTVYLVTGIDDDDYSGLFVGSDGRIFTDYEDPYTTQTYGDTIGQVTFVNGNTVITAEGFQGITIIGATLAYTDITGY